MGPKHIPCDICRRTGTAKVNWRGQKLCTVCTAAMLRMQQQLDELPTADLLALSRRRFTT